MTIYHKDKSLPNRFKECRLENNLSQPQLSSLLGFAGKKTTIYYYETNKRLPNVPTLIKMKKIFNTSLDYLLCLDDYKNHNDFIIQKLGIPLESIDILINLNDINKLKVNNFIHSKYRKEVI